MKKEDPEWRLKHNERCKEYNRKHKEKLRGGAPPRPRGRPKKPTDFLSLIEETLMNEDVDITNEIIYLEN